MVFTPTASMPVTKRVPARGYRGLTFLAFYNFSIFNPASGERDHIFTFYNLSI